MCLLDLEQLQLSFKWNARISHFDLLPNSLHSKRTTRQTRKPLAEHQCALPLSLSVCLFLRSLFRCAVEREERERESVAAAHEERRKRQCAMKTSNNKKSNTNFLTCCRLYLMLYLLLLLLFYFFLLLFLLSVCRTLSSSCCLLSVLSVAATICTLSLSLRLSLSVLKCQSTTNADTARSPPLTPLSLSLSAHSLLGRWVAQSLARRPTLVHVGFSTRARRSLTAYVVI